MGSLRASLLVFSSMAGSYRCKSLTRSDGGKCIASKGLKYTCKNNKFPELNNIIVAFKYYTAYNIV